MAGKGRVLTKDLDIRMRAVEERLAELTARLSPVGAGADAAANGSTNPSSQPAADHQDKLTALEAQVTRLEERVQKITMTLVEQASRWS